MNTWPLPFRATPLAAPQRVGWGVDFSLPEGELLHLAPATSAGRCGWRLQVQAGAVWVTWPGIADDVFLRAGDMVEVPAGRQALLQVEPRLARGAAVLRLAPRRPPAQGRWSGLARPGWVARLR